MQRIHIVIGVMLLLASSFYDNIRGVLIPIIADDLQINYARASLLLTGGNIASLVMTFLMVPLLKVMTDKAFILISIGTTFSSIVFAGLIDSFASFLVFSALAGASIVMLGTMSNIIAMSGSSSVAKTKSLFSVHMVYGIGSLAGPPIASFLAGQGWRWTALLLIQIPFLLILLLTVLLKLEQKPQEPEEKKEVSLGAIQRTIIALFSFYVASEVLSSMWMVTYLTESHRLTQMEASWYASGFFLVLAFTRALSFFTYKEEHEFVYLWGSVLLPLVFLPGAIYLGYYWLLPLVGLAGPFFPVFLSRISTTFETQWRSMTVLVFAFMQLFIGLMHFVLGNVIESFGVEIAYQIPIVFFIITAILLAKFKKELLRLTT